MISKRTRDVAEGLRLKGFKVAVVGPARAYYGRVKAGLLSKVEGLVVPVEDSIYAQVAQFVEGGDYKKGRVEGFQRDSYAYLLAYSADEGRRMALVYSIYFTLEDYDRLEGKRGGLNLFIASVERRIYFGVRVRDVEWKLVIKRNTLLDALRSRLE